MAGARTGASGRKLEGREGIPSLDMTAINAETAMLNQLALRLANTPDKYFVEELCQSLEEVFQLDVVLVGRLNPYTNMIRTVVLRMDGQPAETLVYNLANTPCARVIEGDVCVYPKETCEQFPDDQMLVDLNVQGYVGTPLRSHSGEVVGILVGLKKSPIKNRDLISAVFTFFRDRAASQVEAAEMLERYQSAFSGSLEGFWDWDIQTGNMALSTSIGNMLGYAPAKAPVDISAIEDLIHPEDRSDFKTYIHEHLKTDSPYHQDFRLRRQDSEYCTVRFRIHQNTNAAGKVIRLIGSMVVLFS